jgi:spermidine/putrescine ABC transporter ATP-binding subunit
MSAAGHSVRIEQVSKDFDGLRALDRVSLEIHAGEFFSLLGPSGCGKTTLLRTIAGFETPTSGRIRIGDCDVTPLPPHRRAVNMVFQSYALFPHLNVFENVAFGLRYLGLKNGAARDRVRETLDLVRLSGFEPRLPGQLSGGQRQRVALARALAPSPEVLLLDEPLGALDQKLRKEVQVELKQLQRSLGITFIFVTHDQEEALTLSDRIAVMNEGRVEQLDTSAAVFEFPKTLFVAEFMGAANFFTGIVQEIADGLVSLAYLGGQGRVRLRTHGRPFAAQDQVRFVVRPEKLDLRTRDLSAMGAACLEVTIENRVYQGVNTVWVVRNPAGERFVIYEQNERPFEEHGKFRVGGAAWMCWNPAHSVVVETGGETAAEP